MFDGAVIKLQDARTAIERLCTLVRQGRQPTASNIQIISAPSGSGGTGSSIWIEDPVAFSEAFSSCITQIRSVGDAVLKDKTAKNVVGFKEWRELIKGECWNDDLLKFVNDRRVADFHYGVRLLVFTMHAYAFSSGNASLPSPGATLLVDGTGPYWIVDQGTPRERRVPYTHQEGYAFTVAIIDPPTMHKGKTLSSSDPITVCELAEKYYAELLFEARNKFGR